MIVTESDGFLVILAVSGALVALAASVAALAGRKERRARGPRPMSVRPGEMPRQSPVKGSRSPGDENCAHQWLILPNDVQNGSQHPFRECILCSRPEYVPSDPFDQEKD